MLGIFRYKDRGPTSSSDYNERVRETVESFLDLLGRVSLAEADVGALATLTALEHAATANSFESLSAALEAALDQAADAVDNVKVCTVFDESCVIDVDIAGDPISEQLSWEGDTGLVLLPYTERVSKIGFEDSNTNWVIDPSVKTSYTCDDPDHTTNELTRAIDGNNATAFLLRSPQGGGATRTLTYFLSVPSDSAAGSLVNYIEIDPTPRSTLTLKEVQFTTVPGAALDDITNPSQWEDLWVPTVDQQPLTDRNKRYRAPQVGNPDTVQTNCGKRRYYFGERRVTAVRVVLEADSVHSIDSGNEFFAGIRHIDVGHVTFGASGRLVFEYDMPAGVKTVSAVSAHLVNIGASGDELDGIGSYTPDLTVYYKSGVDPWTAYTLGDSIGSGINQIRIDTSMELQPNGCSPALTGFNVTYARS